jgi:diguanylate cyclase (GGDEF)-like protein
MTVPSVTGEPDTLQLPAVSVGAGESPQPLSPYLLALTGVSAGELFALTGPSPVLIGRSAECGVRLTDASVSRRHARVTPLPDGKAFVVDIGGANGLWVAGARVRERTLSDGDTLRLGPVSADGMTDGAEAVALRYRRLDAAEAGLLTRLRREAAGDPLTGLPNRRTLRERLEAEIAHHRRRGHPLSVALLDADRFKAVNTAHGHRAGDDALRALAATVGSAVRAEDGFGRWGGEEFLLILRDTGPSDAAALAERLRRLVETAPIRSADLHGRPVTLPLTVSLGVAGLPRRVGPSAGAAPGSPGPDADALLAAADRALHRAKAAGRNRVEVEPVLVPSAGALRA